MMQVKETLNEGLKRAYEITVPQADMEEALNARLDEIAKGAKIQGFRPGKAPATIIRQRYGDQARGEVLDRVINDSVRKAMEDNDLQPVVQPKIDDLKAEEGKDVSFKLEVEVAPEIKEMNFADLELEKQIADVADKTVAEAIERVAKSMRQPEEITEDRAAVMGDTLDINFDGKVDGEPRPGMKADNHQIELGTNSFIDTFEDQMVGMKKGEEKDITVTFPEGYHAEELSGKEAVFSVKVNKILAHKPVELDDALAKEIGFPSLEKLQGRISKDIAGNYEQISRMIIKRQLMDKLDAAHSFDLPPTMLESEFQGIWQQILKDKAEGRLAGEDAKKDDKALEEEYRKIAQRRVRLGLLLSHVARKNKLEVTEAELRNAMIAEARRFPGQEQAVVDYYTKNQGAIERLRAPILEDKVIDFILALAKVTEKKIDAEELMKLPETLD